MAGDYAVTLPSGDTDAGDVVLGDGSGAGQERLVLTGCAPNAGLNRLFVTSLAVSAGGILNLQDGASCSGSQARLNGVFANAPLTTAGRSTGRALTA